MEQREESEYPQELEVGPELGGTDQVIECHFDNTEMEERNEEEEKRTTKASTLMKEGKSTKPRMRKEGQSKQ